MKNHAIDYVQDELSTIDALLSGLQPESGEISATIEQLKSTLDRTE